VLRPAKRSGKRVGEAGWRGERIRRVADLIDDKPDRQSAAAPGRAPCVYSNCALQPLRYTIAAGVIART